MPRRPRVATGGLAYHVLNRRVGRLPLFEKSADYVAFEKILAEAHAQTRIRITAEQVDSQIRIHVDDDGIGIPEEERENVFTAFTRLDRSRDRTTGGYGLGLAIARLVLEMHGGTASAAASPLGGARFTLAWPARAGRRA